MKLTVLMIVYNEVKTVLQAIRDIEKITIPDKEVIIIDNCSTDGTLDIIKQAVINKNYHVFSNPHNIGTGGSIHRGIGIAKGEYIYVHHADLGYDPRAALEMLQAAEAGHYDIIIGSRLKNNSEPLWRIIKKRPAYLATILCTALINKWYQKDFTDIIGSRLYRTAAIRQIPVDTFGNGFEFEHISRLCKRGFKVKEIAIPYQPRSWQEGKKIRPYHILNALFSLFKVRYFE